ncbi:MAG: hypothetical protein ACXWN0_04785 [Isosphaeraceae bacterium]
MTTPSATPTAPQARITVSLDSTRMDGARIYQQLFPGKAAQIDFQVVDRDRFPAQPTSRRR